MSRQVLDAVPTGRSIPSLGAMLPGARLALPDVGAHRACSIATSRSMDPTAATPPSRSMA